MTNGKWVTINGAHVFIKDGQSVDDAFEVAMAYSGKKNIKEKSTAEIVDDAKRLKEKKSEKTLDNLKAGEIIKVPTTRKLMFPYYVEKTEMWSMRDYEMKKKGYTDKFLFTNSSLSQSGFNMYKHKDGSLFIDGFDGYIPIKAKSFNELGKKVDDILKKQGF